ncbi:hypothetical protein FOZ62_018279 [Perkinsus olseni]|uniref:deoxyhypusine synthase n=1 Tax=Perkinsus olseni TaxID=32597 RepID=A0A7J6TJW0_PEROL|nr:hypothetical protein FOZ62_018279 [Perkinsus olseni]
MGAEKSEESTEEGQIPEIADDAVFLSSETVDTPVVQGYDFNNGVDFNAMMNQMMYTGFQATNLGLALKQIDAMLDWSLDDEPVADDEEDEFRSEESRLNVRTKVWLSYTSNIISSGCREQIRYIAEHHMAQVFITTAGGIEEDFIKCLSDFHLGDFALDGKTLRRRGLNRTGNLIVPNDNYCKFEEWFEPIIDKMHDEQEQDGVIWTPSKMIHRFGKEINDPRSVYYWCYKNNIPVFCPAITDGSIGDMIYFHSYKRPGFIVDIAADIRKVNDEPVKARHTGVIVIGGGVVKHHAMNANLMRNGADHVVYINTAQEFDGCDSGARPDEAVSWGKIRIDAKPVKVYTEATLVLPLIIGKCFAPRVASGEWEKTRGDGTKIVYNKSYTPSEHDKERRKLMAVN